MEPLTTLAEEAIALALARNMHLVGVESCTAGALTTLLSGIPGAGDILECGFISHSKEFKMAVLGVSPEVLRAHSAVSQPDAVAMAAGALKACENAELAVSITGVGGLKPDDDGNPVGLAHVAVADREGVTRYRKLELDPDNPGRLRGAMMGAALELLISFLTEHPRQQAYNSGEPVAGERHEEGSIKLSRLLPLRLLA